MKVKRLSLVLCMVFIFSMIISGCSKVDMNTEIATVNGEKITAKEFNFFLWTVKERMEYEAQIAGIENFWSTEIEGKKANDVAKEKALEAAVRNKIEMQKAKELGVSLTDEDSKQITEEKKQYVEMWGGREKYQEMLNEKGLNDKAFTEILEKLKISEKLYQKITSEDEKYKFTDDDIQQYYDENKQMFHNPQITAKHILIKTIDDQMQPLPQEKKDEAKKRVEDIYAKVKAGEDFDKLMKEFSEDEGLEQSPDGYTFGKGQMVPEFEDAAFSLEPGEISEIVDTSYGYHIIKLVDKNDTYFPLEQVKGYIKDNILVPQKYNDEVEGWKEKADVKSNQEALKQISK